MIVDPRANEQPEPGPAYPRYAEDGSARGPHAYVPLVLPSLLLIAVIVCAVLGSAVGAVICLVLFLLMALVAVTGLMITLPLGMRLDERGLRIGGVSYNEKHPGRVKRRDAPLRGFTRAMHVYSCPWSGVRRAVVLSSLSDKKLAASAFGGPSMSERPWWANLSGMRGWAPGRFLNASAKGMLIVEVETAAADFQEFRPPRGRIGAQSAELIYTSNTMMWAIPTRHPEELRAALRAGNVPEN